VRKARRIDVLQEVPVHLPRPRSVLLLTAALALAALTSCSTPATTFHFVDAQPTPSRATPGELQQFTGDHTLQADTTSDVADLHWVVTYGSWLNPGASQLVTADGVATLPVTFTAPVNDKRFYRICLSSRSQPYLQTCETIAVGDDALWNGTWAGGLLAMQGTQTGHDVVLRLVSVPPAGSTLNATLTSPFLIVQRNTEGQEVWLEWTSYFEVRVHGFSTGGTPNADGSYSLWRNG
jgi:hypothetical protein